MAHQHRSSNLKQKNKKHKTNASSKRYLNRRAGAGRTNGGLKGSGGNGAANKLTRKDRQHMAAQRRQTKARQLKLLEARGISSTSATVVAAPAPRVIGIVALSGDTIEEAKFLEESVRQHIAREATNTIVRPSPTATSKCKEDQQKQDSSDFPSSLTCHFSNQRKSLTLLTNSTAFFSNTRSLGSKHTNHNEEEDGENIMEDGLDTDELDRDVLDDDMIRASLDLVRVCDAILFVINGTLALHPLFWNDDITLEDVNGSGSVAGMTFGTLQTKRFQQTTSERAERMLTALKAQGLPSVLTALCFDSHHPLWNQLGFKHAKKSSRRRGEVKKYAQRFTITEFGTSNDDSKVIDVDLDLSTVMNTFHPIAEGSNDNKNSMGGISSIVGINKKNNNILEMIMEDEDDDDNEDKQEKEIGTTKEKDAMEDGIPNMIVDASPSVTTNNSEKKDYQGSASSTTITTTSKDVVASFVSTANRPRNGQNSILVRTLCGSSFVPVKWANMRSHMVTDDYRYDETTQELNLIGYLRGSPPLNVNSLVHVPYVGTFAINRIEHVDCPIKGSRRIKKHKDVDMEDESLSNAPKMLAKADPSKRESLKRFAAPDALEGEQNLVGFDEEEEDGSMDDDDDFEKDAAAANKQSSAVARPKGWSDYQVAWLDALDPNMDPNGDDDALDHGELAKALNAKKSDSGDTLNDDEFSISSEERAALAEQRRKTASEDSQFPDEIELKPDEVARDRLARYRSMKSFRTTYWDPKESLPDSYKDIYHFKSFKATQRDILADIKDVTDAANEAKLTTGWQAGSTTITSATKNSKNASSPNKDEETDATMAVQHLSSEDEDDEDDLLEGCVASGSYVRVVLENVSSDAMKNVSSSSNTLLSCVSLLPHENKVSALHMAICQTSTCEPGTVPVKSKDTLTFRCGWRTIQGKPIFSQNNLNSDKHKFERYLVPNAFVAATVFGPITYTPCPVLIYREPTKDNARRQLIAIGSIMNADAERIVVKRIVLTGYPTRVHKRNATVKYMFYNPEDVKWFQPAGLTTKHGLRGHIIDSIGEHGTMKCLFNAPIKQHDTVCLPLFKRVYPKYASCGTTATEGDGEQKLVIL